MTISANPLATGSLPWIPLRDGVAMRPLHFEDDGYALHLKVDPGTVITRHRHTGIVHALNLSGYREIIDTGEIVGPGDYLFEPPGNQDSWRCHGDAPCVVHITLTGRVEYLDANGDIESYSDSATARQHYFDWCAAEGQAPDVKVTGSTAQHGLEASCPGVAAG
jgi:2,4'-dihydroxyacetophenone dioxygenase